MQKVHEGADAISKLEVVKLDIGDYEWRIVTTKESTGEKIATQYSKTPIKSREQAYREGTIALRDFCYRPQKEN